MQENLIIMRPDELQEIINNSIKTALTDYKPQPQPETAKNDLLTGKEFCEKFNISACTRWNWQKQGLIKAKRLKRRIYFSEKECLQALESR
jgi:hypothetical protein